MFSVRRRKPGKMNRPYTPRLETLEDRRLPAHFIVLNSPGDPYFELGSDATASISTTNPDPSQIRVGMVAEANPSGGQYSHSHFVLHGSPIDIKLQGDPGDPAQLNVDLGTSFSYLVGNRRPPGFRLANAHLGFTFQVSKLGSDFNQTLADVNAFWSYGQDPITGSDQKDFSIQAAPGDVFEISYGAPLEGDAHFGYTDMVVSHVEALVTIGLAAPDLVATSLTRNGDGSIDFGYDVRNGPLPRDTTVGVYWASGPSFANHIGDAVYSIPAQTAVGSYGPFTVDGNTLGVRPPGATNLIVMADPDNLIPEDSNRANNVAALDPDIVVDSVSKLDATDFTVNYHVNNAPLYQPLPIYVLRSPTQAYDPSHNDQLGSVLISGADEMVGPHSITVPLANAAPWRGFNPSRYVLAVADPVPSITPAVATPGIGVENDGAYYREYVIGAVSVGFTISVPWSSNPPDWVQNMASSLMGAGYDRVIPYTWQSDSPLPGTAASAGDILYGQILSAISALGSLGNNDVVDIHLIGHSRGAVVISEAMLDLYANPIPQLQQGYFKMTFLDPHPANNRYGLNGSFSTLTPLGAAIEQDYIDFQSGAQDMTSLGLDHASVVVPPSVNEVEILWQNTDVSALSGTENVVNLWGLDSTQIEFQDPIHTYVSVLDPLTGPGIGHSEVHAVYQSQFIPPPGGMPPGGGTPRAPGKPPILQLPSLFEQSGSIPTSACFGAPLSDWAKATDGTPALGLPLPIDQQALDQYFVAPPRVLAELGRDMIPHTPRAWQQWSEVLGMQTLSADDRGIIN